MKNNKSLLLPASMTLALLQAGCGGSEGAPASPVDPAAGVVTQNVTTRAADNAVEAPGAKIFLLGNYHGFDVERVAVSLVSLDTGDGTAYFNTAKPIGPGFSGSPTIVVNSDGTMENWGPLFAGYSGVNRQYFGRPLSQMVSIPRSPTTRAGSQINPISWQINGMSSQRFTSSLQFFHGSSMPPFRTTPQVAGTTRGVMAEAPKPIAGRSLAVSIVSGDVYNFYAVGTWSWFDTDLKRWLVFGHPFEWSGQRQLPVRMAFVDDVVTSWGDQTFGETFKLAHPVGGVIGTMTQDRANGCSIVSGPGPKTIPLDTYVERDGKPTIHYHHELSRVPTFEEEEYYAVTTLAYCGDNALDQIRAGKADVSFTYTIGGVTTTVTKKVTHPYDLTTGVGYWLDEVLFTIGKRIESASVTMHILP